MNMQEIKEKVFRDEERKSDKILNLLSVAPVVREEKVCFKTKRGELIEMTPHGLSSYLGKISIPPNFFKKCSNSLRGNMLTEFHSKHGNQDALLRLIDNKVRFIASDKYRKFDNIDIINALDNLPSGLRLSHFMENEGFFKLRVTTPNALYPEPDRPFYTGIEITNSEIGKSSVKVQLMLFEEVCTNGMIISRVGMPRFRMRHIGVPNTDKLREGVEKVVAGLEPFSQEAERLLTKFSEKDGSELDKRLKAMLPDNMYKKVEETLPTYKRDKEKANGLDYLSAYTEAIQSYSMDLRSDHEKAAGDILWAS